MTESIPNPPIAAVRPQVLKSPHGERSDPYYWLRDDERKNPQVLAYLREENSYRARRMAPLKDLENVLYEEIVARLRKRPVNTGRRGKPGWSSAIRTTEKAAAASMRRCHHGCWVERR